MIDLHSHTNDSDGTLSPEQLVEEAVRIRLEALAITDHDTFAGYQRAAMRAANGGLELVCGIELSARHRGRSVHLLAYFLNWGPSKKFEDWVISLQASRRLRNEALIEKLCARQVPLTLEEVAAHGRGLIARPHFAAAMVEKGYVRLREEAFEKYLGESGMCFVPRDEPDLEDTIARVRSAKGLPVLAHPCRLKTQPDKLEAMLAEMCEAGLGGIEVYHSDHSSQQTELYNSLARRFGIARTGGSDFHGSAKPRVALGTGIGEALNVPYKILDDLRRAL